MEVSWPVAAGWSLVAAEALAFLAWWIVRHARKLDERRKAYTAALAEVRAAEDAYRDAAANAPGSSEVRRAAEAVDEARRRADQLRKAIPALLAVAALLSGCVTKEGPERIVQLDEHIRIVQPGDSIPPYPAGESRWWLLTPTGLMELMPKYRQEEF